MFGLRGLAEEWQYHSGFGNEVHSEAIPGAVPVGQVSLRALPKRLIEHFVEDQLNERERDLLRCAELAATVPVWPVR
jgi:hypothetical protein